MRQPLVVDGGAIRFEHVNFRYDPKRQILFDVDFEDAGRARRWRWSAPFGFRQVDAARLLFRFYDVNGGPHHASTARTSAR